MVLARKSRAAQAEPMTYMTYMQHKDLKPEDFKRLCGIHKETFSHMMSVVQEQVEQKKRKLGKPSKLSIENQVLIILEYWSEYNTYFPNGVTRKARMHV